MPNVTMSIEETVLKKAKKFAVDQNSTISDLFRIFLTDLARRDESRREFLAEELDQLFENSQAASGGKTWTRDDLHERYQLSYWNSQIVACASFARCTFVYSEDMQDGAVYNGVTIHNPFK